MSTPVLAATAAELSAGRPVALACVVDVSGSSPLPVGSLLAVQTDGRIIGSISGGCVEAAVVHACREALSHGTSRLERFAGDDGDQPLDLLAPALTCGGDIDVLIWRAEPDAAEVFARWRDASASDLAHGVALLVAAEGGTGDTEAGLGAPGSLLVATADHVAGGSGRAELDVRLARDARAAASGAHGLRDYPPHCTGAGSARYLLLGAGPRPRLIIIGANEFATQLCRVGNVVGFTTIVVDARADFANRDRLPDAAEVVVQWPADWLGEQELGSTDAICVLTHDPKFDVPVLVHALASAPGYVGAMGSRATHDDRVRRLLAAGVPATALERLHSPIGLDLGAETPAETALAILAEIIADRRGGTAARLSRTDVPIHRRPHPLIRHDASVAD